MLCNYDTPRWWLVKPREQTANGNRTVRSDLPHRADVFTLWAAVKRSLTRLWYQSVFWCSGNLLFSRRAAAWGTPTLPASASPEVKIGSGRLSMGRLFLRGVRARAVRSVRQIWATPRREPLLTGCQSAAGAFELGGAERPRNNDDVKRRHEERLDFQHAVNKMVKHAAVACISSDCWVEWRAGLSGNIGKIKRLSSCMCVCVWCLESKGIMCERDRAWWCSHVLSKTYTWISEI